jgi:hypothetical protein
MSIGLKSVTLRTYAVWSRVWSAVNEVWSGNGRIIPTAMNARSWALDLLRRVKYRSEGDRRKRDSMTLTMQGVEQRHLRDAITGQMAEAAVIVLRNNGTPDEEIEKMRPSLDAAILRWFRECYDYEDPKIAWPCEDCKANYRVGQCCLKRAVIEEVEEIDEE